jgi:3-oxoacyl-[acyl-carrier protein] reductase
MKPPSQGDEIHVKVNKESGNRYRRFPGHWRSDRKASSGRWRKRSHHLCERRQRGFGRSQAIELGGGKAIAIQADAVDVEAVRGAVDKAVATFGRLDVLVNNAGTAIPKPFEETTLEEMDPVININIRGIFVTKQAALKHMKNGGRIINIGSCLGERAQAPGLVPYSTTKGAMKMFTQALSREVGSRGITVNNVQAGPIDTDLNPALGDRSAPQKAATALDRYGRVEEIAAMVAFVAGTGVLLHYRGESYRGRRNDCLSRRTNGVGFPLRSRCLRIRHSTLTGVQAAGAFHRERALELPRPARPILIRLRRGTPNEARKNCPRIEITMAAYLISDVTVRNAEAFQTYRTRTAEAIAKYGGRYLARGREIQALEGVWNPRNIIVEFPSLEQARAWYTSPEYAFALEMHDIALERNLILVDGYRETTSTQAP